MKGGAISHNGGAKRGGGVYLQSGTFTMSGGTISDNASEYGGGVYVWSGTFDMRGGAVTGNRASIGSGGVFMPDSGVFKVSGKVSVTGNKQADDVNNVKLDDEDADITITVVGALAEGAEIGICNTGAVASGFTAAMGDPSDFFVPDDTKNNCVYINSKNSLVTIGKHAPEANDDCTVATKCSNCGKVTAATQTRHLWSDTYESDGTGHWKKCTRSGCNGTDTKSEHTVGTAATCTSGAVCGVCRAVYGQTNADNHAFGTFQAEIPAACTTAGTKGHKDCTLCGKHFDNGGTEISDLTIPALGHDWNDGGVCSVCGAEAKCTVKISFDAPVYYDTFENAWSAAVGSGHAARVTMLDDKELSETLVLEENNVIDLDLNGHALRYTGAVGSVVLIKDKEYLTIIDITDSGRITGGKGRADDGDTVKKGGGVYIEKGGKLLMRGGSISGNTADQGGGVYMAGGEFIMREGSITGNTASSKGGGMYIIVGYGVGSAELGGGEISENNAQYGGGIYVGGGSPQLKWTDISRNTAEVHGGGMYIEKDGSTVSGGSISGNIAQSSGGGIYVGGSSVINIKDIAEISGNTAVSQGGGVYVGNAGKANISGGSISGNTADQGGGAYIAGKTNMTGAVAITDNSSSSYGGGVLVVTDNFDVGSGSVTVGGNKRVEGDPGSTEEIADNVYLWNGKKIKISADPGSARIGVSGNIGTFTDGFGRAFFGTSAPSASIYFYSDKGYCVGKSDGEACLLADHNFSTDYTVDKAPTCTQAGSESRHCTRCGTKTDERAIAAAHSYGDPVYTWSGDNTACTAKRGCTGSGCTAEQIAAATVTSATTAPTCTEGGYDTLTAVFTGGVFSTQTKKVNITSARHTWGAQSVRVEPTCTADGSVTGTCTVCGETDVEILTKLGHDLTRHDAKAPTCTESGFTAYETCSRCDHTTYAEIPALGHSLTHVARRGATAQADGNIEHWACDVCGGKFSDGNGENAVDNVIIKFRLVKPSENGGEERVVVTTPEGFAPDIELVVTEIEKENYGAYETIANTVNGEIDLVYDVTLKSGGVTVQPDGTLTIRLRIPDNLLGKDFKLFHLHGSEATDMEYAVDGNYAVVTADRLSEFIFVGKKKAAKNDLAPLWITLIIILSIVIVGEVGYIAYKYVRKNKAAGGR